MVRQMRVARSRPHKRAALILIDGDSTQKVSDIRRITLGSTALGRIGKVYILKPVRE
jgi:hypothetical protein